MDSITLNLTHEQAHVVKGALAEYFFAQKDREMALLKDAKNGFSKPYEAIEKAKRYRKEAETSLYVLELMGVNKL